eukprot:6491092-Amphidinium_carterae.3
MLRYDESYKQFTAAKEAEQQLEQAHVQSAALAEALRSSFHSSLKAALCVQGFGVAAAALPVLPQPAVPASQHNE